MPRHQCKQKRAPTEGAWKPYAHHTVEMGMSPEEAAFIARVLHTEEVAAVVPTPTPQSSADVCAEFVNFEVEYARTLLEEFHARHRAAAHLACICSMLKHLEEAMHRFVLELADQSNSKPPRVSPYADAAALAHDPRMKALQKTFPETMDRCVVDLIRANSVDMVWIPSSEIEGIRELLMAFQPDELCCYRLERDPTKVHSVCINSLSRCRASLCRAHLEVESVRSRLIAL
jgi:hypothetical protein